MLGANGVVRAKCAHAQRLRNMVFYVSRLLDQSAKSAISVGATRIEQHSETLRLGVGVDAFADGTRGVSAAHRHGLNEKVRQGVQQNIGAAGKATFRFSVLCPLPMTSGEVIKSPFHSRSREPGLYRL